MLRIKVAEALGPEYVSLASDVVKVLIIQLTVQAMYALGDPSAAMLSGPFVVLLWYITIGYMVYHLVFKNLVLIT